MINYKDYLSSDYEIEMFNDISLGLSDEYLNEIHLFYNKKLISIEPVNGSIVVYYNGNKEYYNTIEDMFLQFTIDSKPFIERLGELEYE